jgi:hypothetical protein
MTHRAAIYSVYVHPLYRPNELRRLGNFDKQGTSLAACLEGYFNTGFRVEDGDRAAEVTSSSLVSDEIELMVRHGLSGVAADIIDQKGKKRLRQRPEDTQEIACGGLLQLPRQATTGWWAVHVHGNRSPKRMLYEEIAQRFQADYNSLRPPLKLVVSPVVSGAALREAVEQGQINTVKLTRWDRPKDVRKRITDKWVRKDQAAYVEVGIRAGKGEHVLSDKVRRYLKGEHSLFGQIVEFNGATFDSAKVEVTLENGTTRTFNIENPESGHAFTVELENLTFRNGDPTRASLFRELHRAIEEVT